MVIFCENLEDIYVGIEWVVGFEQVKKVIKFLQDEMGVKKICFLEIFGIGVKFVLMEGIEWFVCKVIQYVIDNDCKLVMLVYKGNIMKFMEGLFCDVGYVFVQKEFGGELIDGGLWMCVKNLKMGNEIVIKDLIVDVFLQQILLCLVEYDVIVMLNLNGDYIFDVLVVQVGGIGIVLGVNLLDLVVMFEVMYGMVLKYVGKDYVNLGFEILLVEMMLCYFGWMEVVDMIIVVMEKLILQKCVMYDFVCLMEGVMQVLCFGFGEVLIENM